MSTKTTPNSKNLASLGAERLADLLMELAAGDTAIKRRLRLELRPRTARTMWLGRLRRDRFEMGQRTVRKISYSGRRPRGRRILADKSNIPLLLSPRIRQGFRGRRIPPCFAEVPTRAKKSRHRFLSDLTDRRASSRAPFISAKIRFMLLVNRSA